MQEPLLPSENKRIESETLSSNGGEYFLLVNSRNAKLIALLLLSIITCYHVVLKLKYGVDTCVGLLKDGRFQGDHIWQPYGCMIHTYSLQNSRMCMKYANYWGHKNHIHFIGDLRLHNLYLNVIDHFKIKDIDGNLAMKNPKSYLKYEDRELNLILEYFHYENFNASFFQMLNNLTLLKSIQKPSVLIFGLGFEAVLEANGSVNTAKDYAGNLTRILPQLNDISQNTTILWMPVDHVNEEKLVKNHVFTNNEIIDDVNYDAEKILSQLNLKFWTSSRLVSFEDENSNGQNLKFGQESSTSLKLKSQILLNFYCNDLMNFADGSCCSRTELLNSFQIISFAFCAICVCIACFFFAINMLKIWSELCKRSFIEALIPKHTEFIIQNGKNGNQQNCISDMSLFFSFSKLCAFILFCYVCDKTNIYMKENFWFTIFNFFMPALYLLVLGLFFTEDTGITNFMHKDQTDEWKGFMQLTILVSNVVGAEKVLWIYMLIRCMISGYLFLLGYGHFIHFWTTGDSSFKRFFSVLLRYNLVVIALCVTMNRPYQFYYFVPMITFWFCVVYTVLVLPPQVTSANSEKNSMLYFALVVKLFLLYGLISMLYLSEVFFENIFVSRPWKKFFVSADDSIQEWWFRWSLDRYSAVHGMTFAFIITLLRRNLILIDNHNNSLFTKRLTLLTFFCSLCGFGIYGFIITHCRSQPDCAEIHSYIFIIPIVSYLMIRNLCGLLRSRVSTFFAWFGRISIELFTIRYHVWLTADGNGVLVFLPRWPVLNVLVTSYIFVCVAHELNSITRRIVSCLVPPDDTKLVMRNFTLLSLALTSFLLYGFLS